VAAIGTAAGAGLFVIAGTGTVLILIVLSLLDWIEDYAKRQLGLGPSQYRLPDDSGEGETERMP
jgi:uncharacterized membrane protein YhiD involved in acid resistance